MTPAELERGIIRATLKTLLSDNFELKFDARDYDVDFEVEYANDYCVSKVQEYAGDGFTLWVRRDDFHSWIRFYIGGGCDVLADYGENLAAALEPVHRYCDAHC